MRHSTLSQHDAAQREDVAGPSPIASRAGSATSQRSAFSTHSHAGGHISFAADVTEGLASREVGPDPAHSLITTATPCSAESIAIGSHPDSDARATCSSIARASSLVIQYAYLRHRCWSKAMMPHTVLPRLISLVLCLPKVHDGDVRASNGPASHEARQAVADFAEAAASLRGPVRRAPVVRES